MSVCVAQDGGVDAIMAVGLDAQMADQSDARAPKSLKAEGGVCLCTGGRRSMYLLLYWQTIF